MNLGGGRDPSWARNPIAEPRATIEVAGRRIDVIAERVTGELHDELWQRWLDLQPSARALRARAGREIPLFVLRRAPDGASDGVGWPHRRPKGEVMYARVVRFTDVDADRIAGRLAEAEARQGPPVDIPATKVEILHDADQRTAVVIQLFESADDMAAAEAALDGMDPADTPGTRASVDRCEIKAEFGGG